MAYLEGERGGELDDDVSKGVDAKAHGGGRQVEQRLGRDQAERILCGHSRPLHDRNAQ